MKETKNAVKILVENVIRGDQLGEFCIDRE
jgi:hypothetical protein